MINLMSILISIITIIAYIIARKIKTILNLDIFNPVLVSAILIVMIMKVGNIEIQSYLQSSKVITSLLTPITILMGVPIYKNLELIKKNLKLVILVTITSIITSFASVYFIASMFAIDNDITNSLLSKSITSPLAVEATKVLNGIESITVFSVILTGIIGALIAKPVIRIIKINSDFLKGLIIGVSSHAIGTSKALEISEKAGAASGLAMSLAGVCTVLLVYLLKLF